MIKNSPKKGFLDFLENGVEWKYSWPFNIMQKPDIWEKSGPQIMVKNALSQSDFCIL